MVSCEGYCSSSPASVRDLVRSCLGLPFELDPSLSERLSNIDLSWLATLLTDDLDALVSAGDGGGMAGTVVFASLQRSELLIRHANWD